VRRSAARAKDRLREAGPVAGFFFAALAAIRAVIPDERGINASPVFPD